MYTKPMNLEDKVINHIHVQVAARKAADVFGIEVELEGKGVKSYITPNVNDWWTVHKEDSLRALKAGDECVEYVTRQPYEMPLLEKAVDALFTFLNDPKVQVYESYRTSIHVHLNFALETFRTVYNFMTLCIILDELLVSQNGEHRIGNNFCLRAKDALGQLVQLTNSIEGGHQFFGLHENERYSSINFASLMKFGSIEFRSLECTTHIGRLMHWIGTLQAIKERARSFKNPMEVIAKFSLLGPREFLTNILGPYALKYRAVDGFEEMLRNGMRNAQDLAYASAWNEIDMVAYLKEQEAIRNRGKAILAKVNKLNAEPEFG